MQSCDRKQARENPKLNRLSRTVSNSCLPTAERKAIDSKHQTSYIALAVSQHSSASSDEYAHQRICGCSAKQNRRTKSQHHASVAYQHSSCLLCAKASLFADGISLSPMITRFRRRYSLSPNDIKPAKSVKHYSGKNESAKKATVSIACLKRVTKQRGAHHIPN